MSKLNPVAQKWVEALRSGKYQQAKDYLRREHGFCCLGVLCDLAQQDGIGKWNGYCFLGESGETPQSVLNWSKLRNSCGDFAGSSLVEENDAGKTFAEIADLIEQHADELFVDGAA